MGVNRREFLAAVSLAAAVRSKLPAGDSGGTARSAHLSPLVWENADARNWIAEPWGDFASAEWIEFPNEPALQVITSPQAGGRGWAIMRTDNFPAENWTRAQGLRVEGWWDGVGGPAGLKLEVRHPSNFDSMVFVDTENWGPAQTWTSIDFRFEATPRSQVGWLSLVMEYTAPHAPTFYFRRISLLIDDGNELWDAMDATEKRNWFYWNNRVRWWHPSQFGAEVKSHNTREAGAAAYLPWDFINGEDAGKQTAEVVVGDERAPDAGQPDKRLQEDWGGFRRIGVDVYCTDPSAPIALFFYNVNQKTGFLTPGKPVGQANQWVTMFWDLTWPSGFPNNEVDSLHFVVQNIHLHQQGEAYFDTVTLLPGVDPIPENIGIHHTFDDYLDEDIRFNDFHNNWGPLGTGDQLLIETKFVRDDANVLLEAEWSNLPGGLWTGIWHSIWGNSDYPEYTVNGQQFDQLQVRIRSAEPGRSYNLKVEFKDHTRSFESTAFTYVQVTDAWQTIALSMNLDDLSVWSHNLNPPDRSRLKEMVFLIEEQFNDPAGKIQIDWIRFVEPGAQPLDLAQASDEDFLDLVAEKTYRYFDHFICREPSSNTYGFHLARSVFSDLFSVASLGFGLTAHVIAVERGWVGQAETEALIEKTLESLCEGPQSDDPRNAIGYQGFFYHFLDHRPDHGAGNGLRKDTTELSVIDTALLIAGALTCREYFISNANIRDMVDHLYRRVNWRWILHPERQQFYWGWKPEQTGDFQVPAPGGGFFTGSSPATPFTADYYTDEIILMDLLGIGSPTPAHRIDREAFYSWDRVQGNYKGPKLVQSFPGTHFTYFFAHCWVEFRNLGKDAPPKGVLAVDWWDNSVQATRTNRLYCIDHSSDFLTYGPDSWGLTAAEGPVPARQYCGEVRPGLYHAYGSLPNGEGCAVSDGTIAPYGAGSSIVFLPNESIAALKNYFGTPLWSYLTGFGDAYNLGPGPGKPGRRGNADGEPPTTSDEVGWKRFNHANFGIDQGPLLIMIENFRSGLIWNAFMRCPEIQAALSLIYSSPRRR